MTRNEQPAPASIEARFALAGPIVAGLARRAYRPGRVRVVAAVADLEQAALLEIWKRLLDTPAFESVLHLRRWIYLSAGWTIADEITRLDLFKGTARRNRSRAASLRPETLRLKQSGATESLEHLFSETPAERSLDFVDLTLPSPRDIAEANDLSQVAQRSITAALATLEPRRRRLVSWLYLERVPIAEIERREQCVRSGLYRITRDALADLKAVLESHNLTAS